MNAVLVERHEVERVRAEGMEAIVRQHSPMVYRIVATHLGTDEAEDATQEVFIQIHRNLSKWRGEASLRTWIYRISTNVALKRLRRRKSRPFVTGLEDQQVAAGEPSPGATARKREQLEALQAALEELPEHQRAVVVLRMQGLSFDEVAAALGIKRPTAESRMSRAKERLRVLLKPQFDPREGDA